MYIDTAAERAKQEMSDDANQLRLGAGHLVKLPGFSDNAPKALQRLLNKDPSVGQYINDVVDQIESQHGSVHADD